MRLLGLHSNYSSLLEAERMNLLAEAISTAPPVDKVEVCSQTDVFLVCFTKSIEL
jgi:hypothetical protein